ncbi:hypothetical protein [Paludibaculum fermentans]|uniref:hypothetical protein n=1 Tax=Paludibaculum fermentans TaxID=1473598 RepID=UPI003EB71F90
MPLELVHIGEDLIEKMLCEISRQRRLAEVACAVSGRTFADDVCAGGLIEPQKFSANKASVCVQTDLGDYACDGAQRIDVLCVGGEHGIAIEAKLGESLMLGDQFRKRFCAPCEASLHPNRRLRGSMIAVLERSFHDDVPKCSKIVCRVGDRTVTLGLGWWLVVRRSVLAQWMKRQDVPVSPQFARVVEFESLLALYGRDRFDALVREVVGEKGFAREWRLGAG